MWNRDFRDLLKLFNDLTIEDLATPKIVYQIGVAPNRVDLMTSVTGLTFPESWAERISARYAALEISVVGRRQLIRNKRALGRTQDRLDLENLNDNPEKGNL